MRTRVLAFILALAGLSWSPQSIADGRMFSRSDYYDVTSRKSLPKTAAKGPLIAVTRYLASLPQLDQTRAVVEALVDEHGRRVYQVEMVCKSAEVCADDSVASSREALEVKHDPKKGWSIVWIGAQFICQKGRGQQEWSGKLCR